VIFFNGLYHLYYALANAQSDCCIGMMSSPTLEPTSRKYQWTDRGLIVSSHKSDQRGAIDPCPVFDAAGNLWLCFGSNYTFPASRPAIFIMPLDPKTGLPVSSPPKLTPLQAGHIEASYIFYHAGFYYLFWNSGGCCAGVKSSYTIHIARSAAITGPYKNKTAAPGDNAPAKSASSKGVAGNTNADASGPGVSGTQVSGPIIFGKDIFLASYTDPALGEEHGPGQIGILSENGVDRFTYHYYNAKGRPVLGEQTLAYDPAGWPIPTIDGGAGN
jgi:beta-xylosidase